MPLRFRNLEVTPDAPVRQWGFEGMLAALDRGYAEHWSRMAAAIVEEPDLEPVFEEAAAAAESASTVTLVRALITHGRLSPSERAVRRLRAAHRATGLTHAQAAEKLGTSRSRYSSYIAGKVTPAMDVLVAAEAIANHELALRSVPELVLR